MKIFSIKKVSGGSRTIYAPSSTEKRELREILSQISQSPAFLRSAHGFMPGRNIVTNALPHIGKSMTISMDLSDFFDTVTPGMVAGKVPAIALEKCFPDGAARQGLPTSPAIANIAAGAMDEAIRKRLAKLQIPGAVYTRYADDLSISCDTDSQEIADKIILEVKQIVSRCGFRVNEKKTRIQRASAGRREVCGLTVDAEVHAPRKQERKLRAARHNYICAVKNGAGAKELEHLQRKLEGLLEFSMLKEPRKISEHERTAAALFSDAKKIAEEYGLKNPLPVEKVITDLLVGDKMYITTDPAMFYGMSVFTTGWTSCMSITTSTHSYKKGVVFWQRLSGVSIAYLAGEGTTTLAGVRRTKMQARCLVYALRDGRKAYGDIYSGRGHRIERTHPLAIALEAQGYIPAYQASNELVVGNVKQPCPLPYFDNTNVETITLAESKAKAYRVRLK